MKVLVTFANGATELREVDATTLEGARAVVFGDAVGGKVEPASIGDGTAKPKKAKKGEDA